MADSDYTSTMAMGDGWDSSEALKVTPGRLFVIPEPEHFKVINYYLTASTVDQTHPWFYDSVHGVMVVWYSMDHDTPIFQQTVREFNERKGLHVRVTN